MDKIKATVRYNGAIDAQVRWGNCDDPRPLLKIGQIYDVVNIEPHSWHTKIELHGVKGKFNEASFDWLDSKPLEEAIEQCRSKRSL